MLSGEDRQQPNHEALRLELVRLRAERRLTFDELATRTGLSRTGLINLERGWTRGSLDTWFHVARALGVPLGSLISRLDDPTEPAPDPPAVHGRPREARPRGGQQGRSGER